MTAFGISLALVATIIFAACIHANHMRIADEADPTGTENLAE